MKKYYIYILLSVILIIPIHLSSQLAKVGTVGAKFLDIGIGSRSVGMGGAFTAVSDDAASVFWNPAALTKVNGKDFFICDVEWLAGIRLIASSYCQKTSFGNIGIFLELLDSGEMFETTESDFDGTGNTFKYQAYQAGISYAKMLTDKFSFGINVKGIREDYTYSTASNFAIDIGSLYYTGWKTLRLGMSLQNFGPEASPTGSYENWQDGSYIDPSTGEEMINEFAPYSMPLIFRIGLAMEIINQPDRSLTVAFDVVHPSDNFERYNLGLEYSFLQILSVRSGIEFNKDETTFVLKKLTKGTMTAGCGLKFRIKNTLMKLDYAFADFGRLPDIHRFSVGYAF
jgi:hypothetical protein